MRREQQHLPKAEKIIIKNHKKWCGDDELDFCSCDRDTLKIDDKKKAEKIMNSIPASKYTFSF